MICSETDLIDLIDASLLDQLFDAVVILDADRRVRFWNAAAEQLTGHAREQILGKCCCEDILVDIAADGSRLGSGAELCAETLRDARPRQAQAYVRHRDRHLVPVDLRVLPSTGDASITICILRSTGQSLQETPAGQLPLAESETGLANRKYLDMRLQSRFEEFCRYGWKFGVLLFTMDRYAEIGAEHGSETADRLLKAMARTLAAGLRSFDVLGRWGENEFLAVVPILEYANLFSVGERMRQVVEELYVSTSEGPVGATVSVGATGAAPGDTVEKLLDRARLWMARSRKGGGNRVTF